MAPATSAAFLCCCCERKYRGVEGGEGEEGKGEREGVRRKTDTNGMGEKGGTRTGERRGRRERKDKSRRRRGEKE